MEETSCRSDVGGGEGGGFRCDSQGAQQLRLCGEKEPLLLSVCKSNENLMRLDFYPLCLPQHLEQFDCTTGSLRRSIQDRKNGSTQGALMAC